MLRIVSDSPHLQQVCPKTLLSDLWSPAWCPRDLGLLPRLWDVAAPRKAEHLSQTHRTPTGHGHGWLHKDAAPIQDSHHIREAQGAPCGNAHISVQAHKHTHSHRFPEYSVTLLFIWCTARTPELLIHPLSSRFASWSSSGAAAKWHTDSHPHCTGTPQPPVPMDSTCLMFLHQHGASDCCWVQLGVCCWMTDAHSMHTYLESDTDACPSPQTGTRRVSCEP